MERRRILLESLVGPGRGASKRRLAISNKVFVGNLSYDVTREELVEAFGAAGRVVDAKVPTDRETGRPRGFAFVEFESEEAAHKSIELLNGKDLKGRPLRVNEAENRPPRPAGAAPRPAFSRPFRPGGPPPEPPPDLPVENRGRRFRTKESTPRRNPRRRRDAPDDYGE